MVFLRIKFQVPNHKYQMVRQTHHPELSRRANPNDQNSKSQTFWPLNIDIWDLFVICDL
jgi:hypothetical protein